MSLEKVIQIGNIYFFAFAISNAFIPVLLHWDKIQESSPTDNTRVYLYIGNIMLIFLCLFFGFSGLFYTHTLLSSSLGLFLLIARACFWICLTFLFLLLHGLKGLISILLFLHLLICLFIHFIPIIFFNMIYEM